jgi:histidine triad (HIT) family protein
MYNHASQDYDCLICLGINGSNNAKTLIVADDIVYRDERVTALINSFWMKNNPGHVIIVPNKHFENIYELPDELGAHIHVVAKKMALAMKKAYGCDGIMTLQNNEPASGQHAFHYHLHIFPRYENDDLHANMMDKQLADPVERKEYADKLRAAL